MSQNEEIENYVTFGRTFENYKWYKPILTLIVTTVIYILLISLEFIVFFAFYGEAIYTLDGGYEALNAINSLSLFTFITIILFIPSIYIASKIVRDRPFSSYASLHGGWNWKLYLKCLIIPIIIYAIFQGISCATEGVNNGVNQFTIPLLIAYLILVPLQCIGEEFFFRGLIMQTLGSWIKIPLVAIIIQALIFTIVHPYNLTGMIAIFISGTILGIVAWKTNGLEAGAAIHTVNNLFSFLFIGFGITKLSSNVTIEGFIIDILVSLITAGALLYVGRKYGWFD